MGRSLIGLLPSERESSPSERKSKPTTDTRQGAGRARGRLASEAGDTLIEVLIGAFLVGLIVVGVFSGLNSTNRATSIDRARSQADALAEQNEEQLRSEPIKKLYELESHPETKTVTEGKTVYTIDTSATYIADSTATSSCTSTTAEANYLQTTSRVSSPLIGAGKSVEESGIISPPAGSALIAQVTYSGTPIQGAKIAAEGPAPATTQHELETSVNGCAILAVAPGEYNLNASKSGYVDPNGYKNTNEDSSVTRSVYIPAETTSKVGYNLGLAGKLAVSFSGSVPAEGDTFVAFNTGMTSYRPFGTLGTYSTTVESPTPASIFPFTTKYTVYAGSCEANLPTKNGQSSNPETIVEPGKTAAVTVPLAPVNIKVMSGTAAGGGTEGTKVTNYSGTIEDTGCNVKRTFASTLEGKLQRPGMPFGNYTVCVTALVGAKNRKATYSFPDNNASGVTVPTFYLGGASEGSCP